MNHLLSIMLILIGACIILELYNASYNENFTVIHERVDIPQTCPNYLYVNGGKYYLYNSKQYLSEQNPKAFSTLEEAETYWKLLECPKPHHIKKPIPKKNEDPSVNYERACNTHIAYYNNKYEYDLHMMGDNLKDIKQYLHQDRDPVNYDLDTCVANQMLKDNKNLRESSDNIQSYYNTLDAIENLL